MANDTSKLTINGNTYDIKDPVARSKSEINDAASSASTTYSSNKINSLITIDSISLGGVEQPILNKNVDLPVASYEEIANMMGRDVSYILTNNGSVNGKLYSDGTLLCVPHQGSTATYTGVIASIGYIDGSRPQDILNTISTVVVPYGTEYTYQICTGCYNLSNVMLPSTLKGILGSSFYNCVNLLSFNVPDGVYVIGRYAFQYSRITRIVLPDTITTFEEDAFNGTYHLTDIYFKGTQAQWEAIEGLSEANIPSGCTIHYNYID